MSNTEGGPERSARRHRPAILAIIAVFVLVGLAILILAPSRVEKDDINLQASPAAPAPQVEGTLPADGNATGIAPADANTPAQGAGNPAPAE